MAESAQAAQASEELVASRAGVVLGYVAKLKENAAASFREVSPPRGLGRQRPRHRRRGWPQTCPASSRCAMQAKPWSEVLDRTAFAKPSGMAEVCCPAQLAPGRVPCLRRHPG